MEAMLNRPADFLSGARGSGEEGPADELGERVLWGARRLRRQIYVDGSAGPWADPGAKLEGPELSCPSSTCRRRLVSRRSRAGVLLERRQVSFSVAAPGCGNELTEEEWNSRRAFGVADYSTMNPGGWRIVAFNSISQSSEVADRYHRDRTDPHNHLPPCECGIPALVSGRGLDYLEYALPPTEF